MNLAADMGHHSGRLLPPCMTPYIGNSRNQSADDPLIRCQSLCRQTRPPLTDKRAIDAGNNWGPLGFIVRDCAASHADLIAMGAHEVRAPGAFGAMSVSFVSDPEGHEIELLQLSAAS